MTIQISLILWTVICFVLFALIVYKLLFVPLLSVMDKRREKLDAARLKTETDAKAAAEAESLRLSQLEEQTRLAARELKRSELAARENAAVMIDEAKERCAGQIERKKRELELSEAGLRRELDDRASALAADFAAVFTNTSEV